VTGYTRTYVFALDLVLLHISLVVLLGLLARLLNAHACICKLTHVIACTRAVEDFCRLFNLLDPQTIGRLRVQPAGHSSMPLSADSAKRDLEGKLASAAQLPQQLVELIDDNVLPLARVGLRPRPASAREAPRE
jgi:hypothetical protein